MIQLRSLVCSSLLITMFFSYNLYALQSERDGEILNILVTLDENEIAAANLILNKSPSMKVRKYAEMIQKEHYQNLKEALLLSKKLGIKLASSELIISLKREGKDELRRFSRLDKESLDQLYIKYMIKDHAKALYLMHHQMLKSVTSPKLKAFLINTQSHLEKHLNQAQLLQKNLH